jgi:hypothetical protein
MTNTYTREEVIRLLDTLKRLQMLLLRVVENVHPKLIEEIKMELKINDS